MRKAKKRFIDANALKKAIDHTGVDMLESADYFGFTYKKIMRVIDDAPTADVAPVVHGRWIEKDDGYGDTYYDCSACGESFCLIDGTPKDNLYIYCPNCSAKMDG